jgi:uncharacterized phage protein (TIGR01671 family)
MKFRAFNKKTNLWIHKNACDILGEMICLGGWMEGVSRRDFNNVVVMQFTGLKDNKGVEIFEGDIIKGWIHDMNKPHVVTYRAEEFKCGFWGTVPECKDAGIELWYKEVHVVGNIFDNPELIQKKDAPQKSAEAVGNSI